MRIYRGFGQASITGAGERGDERNRFRFRDTCSMCTTPAALALVSVQYAALFVISVLPVSCDQLQDRTVAEVLKGGMEWGGMQAPKSAGEEHNRIFDPCLHTC